MKLKIMTIIVSAILLFTACAQTPTGQVVQEDTVKVGVVTATTGRIAPISTAAMEAIQFAAKEYNEGAKTKIEVVYEDTQGTAQGSIKAFNKVVDVDQVDVVITDISTSTLSLYQMAEDKKVPLIAYLTTSPVAREKGSYAFRTSPMNDEGMKLLAEELVKEGIYEVGTITELNDYPKSLQETFASYYQVMGGEILSAEEIESSTDIKTTILKTQSKKPGALVVFTISGAGTFSLFKQINEMGVSLPVYGNEIAAAELILNQAPEMYEDYIYAGPKYSKKNMEILQQKFSPKNDIFDWLYIATAYDSFGLIAEAKDSGARSSEDIHNYLVSIDGYDGLSGFIKFDNYGDPTGTEYSVFQVSEGKKLPLQ